MKIYIRKCANLAKTLLRQIKFSVASCDNTAQQEGKHETRHDASVSFNTVVESMKLHCCTACCYCNNSSVLMNFTLFELLTSHF